MSITVRIESLFACHSDNVRSVLKTDEGEAESNFLLIIILWERFNCWWLRSGGVGQKVLFRTS